MISYVRGELVAIEDDKVILDVNGVGFGIYMPAQSMTLLPTIGEEVRLHTYMNVREDAMQLFGFLTRDDLNVFKLVIGVSGIGPKGGLNILSQLSPDDLRFAVMANDANRNELHELRLENREKLTVSNVQEVESFDENTVALLTGCGLLIIRGENLQLKALSIDGGQVCVRGTVHSLDYEEPRKPGSFFKRLFG